VIAETTLPAYVYKDSTTECSLYQGDILKVDGEFRKLFKEFYPSINHPDDENKYAMVLTQSCDLVSSEKRKPKVSHVNVCLVRSLKAVTQRLIDEINPYVIDDKKIFPKNTLDGLKDKISKLLNNSDQKTFFFLPHQSPFTEDMVAILPLSFSFRVTHYDLLMNLPIILAAILNIF
jgi:hypothetical protein